MIVQRELSRERPVEMAGRAGEAQDKGGESEAFIRRGKWKRNGRGWKRIALAKYRT
jgi:hypothetical protein